MNLRLALLKFVRQFALSSYFKAEFTIAFDQSNISAKKLQAGFVVYELKKKKFERIDWTCYTISSESHIVTFIRSVQMLAIHYIGYKSNNW